ncbi:MAG: dihydroorotate dehydrogenase electron transfer subunit [Planctomycetes bacterium]|nr:dihydroorotate dehydrogenase electron transfer subunit [Planctomycetota bacterium]
MALCPVLTNRAIDAEHGIIELRDDGIACGSAPGRFIEILCADGLDPLLRRPFSIFDADPASGTFAVLYRVVGPGTRFLAARRPGDRVDVLGPLGRGFDVERARAGRAVLVAGGVGLAPIAYLARALPETDPPHRAVLLYGAATRDRLVCLDALARLPVELRIATDDGSAGERGRVTELLAGEIDRGGGAVFACGPSGMNEAVRIFAVGRGIPCQISLEPYMACGYGACYGCVVPVRAPRGEIRNVRVCVEGPVFEAETLGGELPPP